MSAPTPAAPEAVPPPARRKWRVLLAALLATAVVGLIWPGFGLLGLGTDFHITRAGTAFGAAFVCALIVVSRARRTVRLLALLAAFGSATAAWCFVPEMDDWLSLAEADARRAELALELKKPLLEGLERGKPVLERVSRLYLTYPELARTLRHDCDKWIYSAENALKREWAALAVTDCAGARDLVRRTEQLPEASIGGASARQRYEWSEGWAERALAASEAELAAVPLAHWAGFDRTAPVRKELTALLGIKDLADAESGWVMFSVQLSIDKGAPVGATSWADLEDKLLALDGVTQTEGDGRFRESRLPVFARAHEAAQRAAAKHIEAREYDAAFAVARAHAVRWNATASMLGEEYTQRLDKLRDACAVFARLAEIAGPPDELAPAPREREVAPPPREKP